MTNIELYKEKNTSEKKVGLGNCLCQTAVLHLDHFYLEGLEINTFVKVIIIKKIIQYLKRSEIFLHVTVKPC